MPDPEPSIGRKILGFFIKEEPDATSATGPAKGTPPTGTTSPPRPAPNATSAPTPAAVDTAAESTAAESTGAASTAGNIDPKFAEHLADVLAKNNPSGPDYFEFRETLRSLNNLGLTEDKQYQAAWASFKALGGPADVNVLTNTANQYLTALSKDRDGFGKSVEAALTERVGGLQNEQKRLQTDNEALAKQLLEIQKQIDANNNRLSSIGSDIAEQSTKISQNKQNYETTFSHFTEQIKRDMAKMKQYLQ